MAVGPAANIRLYRLCAPRLVRDRIVCLPAAGAGPTFFRSWHKRMPPWTEVWVAELPGHGSRFFEPPCDDGRVLVDALARALGSLKGAAFHLFGHSFGGTLAAQAVRMHPELPGVRSLIVSASLPPHFLAEHLPRIDEARLLRSVQAQVLGDLLPARPLLPFFKRALRADLSVLSSFAGAIAPRVKVPMAVFAGLSDGLAPLRTMRGWSALADGDVSLFAVPAGHFFFHRPHAVDFFKALAGWLERFEPMHHHVAPSAVSSTS